jgi:hypothetical protein
MKKSFLALAVVLGASTTFAQDLTSKKGENYLPEAGDWAISVDATPFLNYIGNFFGKAANNTAPTFNFLATNNAIMGKYFVEEGMAYRAGINIGFGSQTQNALVPKVGTTTNEEVEDTKKTSNSTIAITVGLEKRKGNTRLQGFYGADLGIGFGGGSKTAYAYGNSFDFINNPSQSHGVDGATDVIEIKQKGGLMIGLRAFIGAEYFILPKLALGGEFGWGIGLMTTGEASRIDNQINNAGTGLEEKESITASKGSSFNLGTDNKNSVFGPSASLRISFHF